MKTHKSKWPLSEEEDEILTWIQSFKPVGVHASTFQITKSGISKGLIDANKEIRDAFKETGFHDFYIQPEGQDSKRLVTVHCLTNRGVATTKMSMYRSTNRKGPRTGDPRFWIYNFTKHFPIPQTGGHMICLAQDGNTCVAIDLTSIIQTQETTRMFKEIFTNGQN